VRTRHSDADGLLPRMEAVQRVKGVTYRYHPKGEKPVHLGRDREAAFAKYHLLTATKPDTDLSTEKAALEMWRRHKKGASQRRIDFSKMHSQRFRCAVTSMAFKDEKPKGLRIRPWMPSIDRIDSKAGYAPGNIRIVCGFVNVAMNGFGEAFFSEVLHPLIDAQVKARLAKTQN
jgi:hypothetical protein